MTKQSAQVQEEISPNLIPMVDIMFLLLLFFMLSADMGQRELEELRPPKAASAKKVRYPADRAIVNIFHRYEVSCLACRKGEVCHEAAHWRVAVRGHEAAHANSLMKYVAGRDRVLIRADRSAPYGLVQETLNGCVAQGIYKVECGVAVP